MELQMTDEEYFVVRIPKAVKNGQIEEDKRIYYQIVRTSDLYTAIWDDDEFYVRADAISYGEAVARLQEQVKFLFETQSFAPAKRSPLKDGLYWFIFVVGAIGIILSMFASSEK